jgi:cystathionine gamma-synthase
MVTQKDTLAVHAGEPRPKPYNALTVPTVQTSTYTFENTAAVLDFMAQKEAQEPPFSETGPLREEYGRYGNPTIQAAEDKLAALEGGERAVLFATGMAAITSTLLTFLSAGDHAVFVRDSYRRTRQFAAEYLPRWGVETTLVSIDELDGLEGAIQSNTKLIFGETPTNPYLRIMDLAKTAEIAKSRDVLTIVDTTFATPLNLHPLTLGIDLVIHSATKYLGGHNDLLAGGVVGSRALVDEVEESRGILGGMGSPHDAYLLVRGMKTVALRVQRQNESALAIAQHLEAHPAVARVYYPGLTSHPDHEVAVRQMEGFGGVVSFEVDATKQETSAFMDRLQVPHIGPTLGGVESIAQQQALFISLDPEKRRASGISDTLIRYAVGVEAVDDLIADLDQALAPLA